MSTRIVDDALVQNFYFIQGADPQFGRIYDVKLKEHGLDKLGPCNWDEDMKLAERAVEKVNSLKPKPKFFVICGDLTNEFPECDINIKSAQIADFKRIFGKIDPDIPLVCVCGNHDIGDAPTPESVAMYRSTYGEDYFSFYCGDILFIVINTQYYKDPRNVQELARQHEEWLDDQLSKPSGKRIICLSHIPWFVDNVEEAETISNIPIDARKRMLEKLHNAGVSHVFCGHYHANAGGMYKDLEIVVTAAIGGCAQGAESGLRVVTVKENTVEHCCYSYNDFPSHISL